MFRLGERLGARLLIVIDLAREGYERSECG